MKAKIFTIVMLLIVTFGNASALDDKTPVAPTHVVDALEDLINACGQKQSASKQIYRNPITNQLETSIAITPFQCDANSIRLSLVGEAFLQDYHCGYKFMHKMPGEDELVTISIGNTAGQTIQARSDSNQEFYLLAVKNANSPRLRDVYAIAWSSASGNKTVAGHVYLVTSPIPELMQDNFNNKSFNDFFSLSANMHKRMPDSLVAMPDSYNELLKKYMPPSKIFAPDSDLVSFTMQQDFMKFFGNNYYDAMSYLKTLPSTTRSKILKLSVAYQLCKKEIGDLSQKAQRLSIYSAEYKAIQKQLKILHKKALRNLNELTSLISQ